MLFIFDFIIFATKLSFQFKFDYKSSDDRIFAPSCGFGQESKYEVFSGAYFMIITYFISLFGLGQLFIFDISVFDRFFQVNQLFPQSI